MKYFSVALLAIAAMAASLGADLWLTADKADEWGTWSGTLVIFCACLLVWFHLTDSFAAQKDKVGRGRPQTQADRPEGDPQPQLGQDSAGESGLPTRSQGTPRWHVSVVDQPGATDTGDDQL